MKLENTLKNLRKNKHSFFNVSEGYINYDLLKNDLLIFFKDVFLINPLPYHFKKTNKLFYSFNDKNRLVICRETEFNIYIFKDKINNLNRSDIFYYGLTKNSI